MNKYRYTECQTANIQLFCHTISQTLQSPCTAWLCWVLCVYLMKSNLSAAKMKEPTEALCPVCWWGATAPDKPCPGQCSQLQHRTSAQSSAPSPLLSQLCPSALQALQRGREKYSMRLNINVYIWSHVKIHFIKCFAMLTHFDIAIIFWPCR